MAIFQVQNQWGGNTAPWHPGGTFVLGCRDNQNVVAIDIKSSDDGKSFTGTMTYAGEGPIGVKATQVMGNNYTVENQWGGDSAPWHPGGSWEKIKWMWCSLTWKCHKWMDVMRFLKLSQTIPM